MSSPARPDLADHTGRKGLDLALSRVEPLLVAAVAESALTQAGDVTPDRVRRAVNGGDAMPLGARVTLPHLVGVDPRLDRLITLFDLDPVDTAALLLAVSVDVDARYGVIFACANGEPGRRRPAVGLVADLLSPDPASRTQLASDLAGGARPIVRLGLAAVLEEPNAPRPRRLLTADPQVTNWLLGTPVLDPLLESCVRIDGAPAPDWARDDTITEAVLETREDPRLQVVEASAPDGLAIARAIAAKRGQGLLVADLGALPAAADALILLDRLVRQAWLWEATVAIERPGRLDDLPPGVRVGAEARLAALPSGGIALVGDGWKPEAGWPGGVRFHALERGAPDRSAAAWREAAGRMRRRLTDDEIATLTATLRLRPSEIFATMASVDARASDVTGLQAAARRNTGQALERLAARVPPSRGFAQLVAPPAVEAALNEILTLMRGRRLARGEGLPQGPPGLVALFAGPSGTGKSLAGEVLASELGLDLFRADTASLIDKYIGETEKNLERLFVAAEDAQAVLLFDEADALFGKRSEVTDARDRYANQEVAYLLQRLERFDGLAILSTNLVGAMDEAFLRRLEVVYFPFPGADERERLWRLAFPDTVAVAGDVAWRELADAHVLSGGHIHAAARMALIFARSEDREVTRGDLERAVSREFAKLGRPTAGGVRP